MRMRPSTGEFSCVCCRLIRNINLSDAKQRLFNPEKRAHTHVTHFAPFLLSMGRQPILLQVRVPDPQHAVISTVMLSYAHSVVIPTVSHNQEACTLPQECSNKD